MWVGHIFWASRTFPLLDGQISGSSSGCVSQLVPAVDSLTRNVLLDLFCQICFLSCLQTEDFTIFYLSASPPLVSLPCLPLVPLPPAALRPRVSANRFTLRGCSSFQAVVRLYMLAGTHAFAFVSGQEPSGWQPLYGMHRILGHVLFVWIVSQICSCLPRCISLVFLLLPAFSLYSFVFSVSETLWRVSKQKMYWIQFDLFFALVSRLVALLVIVK
jgi:hypothetical protein